MKDFHDVVLALNEAAQAILPIVGGKPAQAAAAAGALVNLYDTVRDTLVLDNAQVEWVERNRDEAEKQVLAHLDRTAASLADD